MLPPFSDDLSLTVPSHADVCAHTLGFEGSCPKGIDWDPTPLLSFEVLPFSEGECIFFTIWGLSLVRGL